MIALMQVRGSQVSMGAEGGSNALSTENGCSLQNLGASAKLWLGRGLHTGTTDEPQPRGNARWGRFWVAVLVRVLGLGAMKSQR